MQPAFLLAFFPRPEGGTAPVRQEWVEASDWFVLFTLGTLFFLLSSFAIWAWLIWRRTTRPRPHVRLLMELEEGEPGAAGTPAAGGGRSAMARGDRAEPAPPWQQPADWWKNAESATDRRPTA